MKILVVMAMRAEAKPVVEAMGLAPISGAPSPNEWFASNDQSMVLALNGVDPIHGVDSIGTTPAALTTQAAINHFVPDLVVSTGTAGGFASRGGTIGQVVAAHGPVIHHDRRIPLGPFAAYGLGEYPTADCQDIAAELGFSSGPCSTGDSLDAPELDMAAMDTHGTLAKDMEAAAVAGVATRAGVAFTALKVITDIVDSPESTAEQFEANLAVATQNLAATLPRFLAALSAQT